MLGPNEQKAFKEFFDDIPASLADGSNDATISYLALTQGSTLVVVAARMTLGDDLADIELPSELRTPNVRAGHFQLKLLGRSVHDYLVTALNNGSVEIPDNTLFFPHNPDASHGAWYRELSEAGLHANKRVSVLSLFGGHRQPLPAPEVLDWELKAASPPFAGLSDLAQVYRFGPLTGGTITFDVVAPEALEVLPESTVKDGQARIVLAVKYKLDRSAASLRLRVESHGQTVDRLTRHDGDIEWQSDGTNKDVGIATIPVPFGATVHCVAVYAGRAQHERTLVDKSAHSNTLRTLFEAADEGLDALKARLASGRETKTPGRDLEVAIAWLLGMLGFQVLHLGSFDRAQDGVDIIARSPSGGVLLVECTTDILKEDKTGKLLARIAKLRRHLAESGAQNVSIVPVMLTTAPQEQVEQRIASTESSGVLVMTAEQVEEWVELSAAAPDADREFARLERRLADAQARIAQARLVSDYGTH